MPNCVTNYSDEISVTDKKNIRTVKCVYCNSTILTPLTASFLSSEYQLPAIAQKKVSDGTVLTESVKDFWQVDDIYHFYNVGFSNTVGDTKYLTCADCDAGPIGYHDIPSKISYVALSRVKHS